MRRPAAKRVGLNSKEIKPKERFRLVMMMFKNGTRVRERELQVRLVWPGRRGLRDGRLGPRQNKSVALSRSTASSTSAASTIRGSTR
jgi:hypothetical protein